MNISISQIIFVCGVAVIAFAIYLYNKRRHRGMNMPLDLAQKLEKSCMTNMHQVNHILDDHYEIIEK